MKRLAVGIGDALWDCFPDGKKIGGAPANFAYYMAQFGYDAMAVTAVGEDQLGAGIKETFDRIHLDHIIQVNGYPTGTVMVDLDDKGIPTYNITEDVAYDYISYTPDLDDIARRSNVACFGTLAQRNPVSRDTIRRFLESMPQEEDTYKVFDINLRQHYYDMEIVTESLRLCNVLKINDEELVVVKEMYGYGAETDRDACRRLISEWDLKFVILTCGVNGSYVYTENEESFMETPKVEVADTVGAGDSFISAFMASILKEGSIKNAHALAVKVSAYVCTQYGGMRELPSMS